MKKLLILAFLLPSVSYADRLGSLTRDSDVQLSTQTAPAGASSLSVNDEGVQISSPTSQINFVGDGVTVTLGGSSTATVTISGGGGSGDDFGSHIATQPVVASSGVTTGSMTVVSEDGLRYWKAEPVQLPVNGGAGPQVAPFIWWTKTNIDSGIYGSNSLHTSTSNFSQTSGGAPRDGGQSTTLFLEPDRYQFNFNVDTNVFDINVSSVLVSTPIVAASTLEVGHTSIHHATASFYGDIDVSSSVLFDSRLSVYQSSGIAIPKYTLQDLNSPTVSPAKIGTLSEYTSVESNNAVTGGVGISGVCYVPRLDRVYLVDNNALGIHVLRAGDLSTRIASVTLSGFNDPEGAEFMDYRYNDDGELVGLLFAVAEEQLNQIVIFEVSPSTQPQVITKTGSLILRPSGLWTLDATEGMESITWNPHKRVFYVAKQNTNFEFFVVPYDGTFNPTATEPFDAEAVWGSSMPAINDLSYDLETRTCYAIGDLISSSTNDQDILHFDCETGDIIEHWNNYIDDAGLTTAAGWVQSEGIAVYHGIIWVSSEGNEVARLEKGGSGSSPWTQGTGVMTQTTAETRPEARYSTDGTVVGMSLIQDLGAVDMDGNEILCLDFERYDNNELESSQSVAHRGRICSETPADATSVAQESGGQLAIYTTLGSASHGVNTSILNMKMFNTSSTTVYGQFRATQSVIADFGVRASTGVFLTSLTAQSSTTFGGAIIGKNLTAGTSGYVWTSNGNGLAPDWLPSTGGSGTPGGSDTEVQFNNASSFDGDPDFTFDISGRVLAVGANTVGAVGEMTNGLYGNNIIYGTITVQNHNGLRMSYSDTAGLILNPDASASVDVIMYADNAVPILWMDASADTLTFGDDFDLGGTIGIVALADEPSLVIRQLTGQTNPLTTWQEVGTGQVAAMSPAGVLTLGSSTGVNLSGASGVITFAGIGGSNNESLLINLESTSNTAAFTSGTGVTALSFSGMSMSASSFTGSTIHTDNVGSTFGSGSDVRMEFDSTEANDTFKIATSVPDTANNSGTIMITDNSGISTNYQVVSSTYPRFRTQAPTGANIESYWEVGHDATNARMEWGGGSLQIVNKATETVVNISTRGISMLAFSTCTFSVFNVAGSTQQVAIPDATGGAIVDAEARTALNRVLQALRNYGWVAP